MAFFRKGTGRTRELIGKVALGATVIFGFVSIIFSRDFGGAGRVFHDPMQDGGIAHADAPASGAGDSGAGDSAGSGSSSDSAGGDSGGSGGSGG
jgi:hypothetical protein